MYVDESGDCGLSQSPTRYFVLTGLVVHELRWRFVLDHVVAFRREIKHRFGLRMRDELHASALMNRPGALVSIKKYDRLAIVRSFADTLAHAPELNVINVVVDKSGKPPDYDVFEKAWTALIQRLENTLAHRNFSGPRNADDRGMLFPDRTDDKKLTRLLRKLRHFNPVPSPMQLVQGGAPAYRNLSLLKIIEDPNFRDSEHSLMIQAADLCAFLLYQHLAPNEYMRKKGGASYFRRLEPILCKAATPRDPMGIVRF